MHLAIITALPPGRGTLCEYGEHLVRAFAENPAVTRLSVIADVLPEPQPELFAEFFGTLEVRRVWRFNDLASAWKIRRALDDLKPDAVLFNVQFASFGDQRLPAALGLLAPWLARVGGFPTTTLMHNLMETVDLNRAGFGSNPIMEFVTRTAGRMFTRAILQSNLVGVTMPRYAALLRREYGAKNVFLSPHGAFRRTVAPVLPAGKTVMTFGKFGTYKTVEPLLEAHKLLLERDPSVRLVIAGSDSPNAAGYLERVKLEYANLPNVTFTGYVPEERVAEIFCDCTVVAFPYTSTTGSSGPLHQAGEFARAAVMPHIGDLAELIEEEGYRAEFFEPENVQSLADALWRALEPERALELGLANHAAATSLTLSDVACWHGLHFQRLIDLKTRKLELSRALTLALTPALTPALTQHLALKGHLEAVHAVEIRESLEVAASNGQTLELDLSQVESIDGAGLAAVVCGLLAARKAGGSLLLVAPSDPVRKLLADTALDRVIPILESHSMPPTARVPVLNTSNLQPVRN
jgi:anti-anti-sigma factor